MKGEKNKINELGTPKVKYTHEFRKQRFNKLNIPPCNKGEAQVKDLQSSVWVEPA